MGASATMMTVPKNKRWSIDWETGNPRTFSIFTDVAMATDLGHETMMEKFNKERVPQDNPMLIDMIKTHFLEPPSTLPYELSRPEKRDFSSGQSYIIDSLMNHKVSLTIWSYLKKKKKKYSSFNSKYPDQTPLRRLI